MRSSTDVTSGQLSSFRTPDPSAGSGASLFAAPPSFVEYQRLQLFDYGPAASRLRIVQPGLLGAYAAAGFGPYPAPGAETLFGFPPFFRFDPRSRFVQEEPKPQHSYIGLIAMAILSSVEKKMVLSDIYQYILDNYPYFRNRGPGWRNSIRHNLSLNDCFVKAGRSANGKGHYWAIHPANVEDFKKGDFRRRKAQRKVRRHMGLSVPEEDDSPTPTPPPAVTAESPQAALCWENGPALTGLSHKLSVSIKRRQFDMESLLAPDPSPEDSPQRPPGAWCSPCPLVDSLPLAASAWAPQPSTSLLAIHQERLSLFRAQHQDQILQRWCSGQTTTQQSLASVSPDIEGNKLNCTPP
ncbi:hypothetical protein HPB47_026049 [Ixodes persulcatus]|uniref:Uncharacterized protein n=1 Tax=Ixodes persulcatus TaxID=34615 RepID=A0AC60Q065_IXOPE|nr:hypothetical protein HPB47_026049 [Ixodes persulcatus]